MTRRVRRILALGGFSIGVNLRRGITGGGILLGLGLMVLGPIIAVANDRGWTFDGAFGFFGFLVIALFLLRSGLEEQRELGLRVFLCHNFATPAEHAAGMIASLIGSWATLCGITFSAILLISAGDLRLAGWYTTAWGVRSLLVIGLVPLVEQLAAFRLPFLLPAIAYAALLVTLSLVLPEDRALALFIPVERGDLDALLRLAGQAVVVFPLTAALTFAAITPRRRVAPGARGIRG